MEKNRKILNEAFFGKDTDTHYDKLLKSLPQYAAVDSKGEAVYQVNDTDEMKKRLAGTFGVTFGNNSIKSLASKAVKTFPIIISDAVEVETGVILKKLMEEQYAEYINMLVSNQVIDLSNYSTSETDGNIAIQALDSISGTDFSKSRVPDIAARTGKVSVDDVFKNIPLYQLLRESDQVLTCGDPTMDALLESAIVVKNDEDVEKVVEFLTEALTLDEDKTFNFGNPSPSKMSASEIQAEIEKLEAKVRDLKGEKEYKEDTKKFYGGVTPKAKTDFDFYSQANNISGATIARNIDAIIGQINTGLNYSYLREPAQGQIFTMKEDTVYTVPTGSTTVPAYTVPTGSFSTTIPAGATAPVVTFTSGGTTSFANPSTKKDDKPSTKKDDKETKPEKHEEKEDDKPNLEKYKPSDPRLLLLTSPDAILGSSKNFDNVMNRSIGEMILDPRNAKIRDRFEKATFLLQSRRIAGIEYYNYLTMRLGIPVSDATRTKLVTHFRIKDVRSMQSDYHEHDKTGPDGFRISKDEIVTIAKNRRLVDPIVKDVCNYKVRHVVSALGGGTVVGAGAALVAFALGSPILWPVVAGAGAGAAVGFLASAIAAIREKKILRKAAGKIEGWERVEALIVAMEKQQEEVRNLGRSKDDGTDRLRDLVDPTGLNSQLKNKFGDPDSGNGYINSKEFKDLYNDTVKMYSSIIKESVEEVSGPYSFNEYTNFINEECREGSEVATEAVVELLESDQELKASLFEEMILNEFSFGKKKGISTSPVRTQYIEKKPGKTALVVPAYMSRTQYAYGSTEIERRDVKDRKYNQPLIMTVKFRERFSDGKLSDNQLTAVIGILGKVIRVPSSEMEEILKQNASGSTIDGFFKDGKGDLANTITDMIGKAKKEASNKNLSKSGNIWHNLEKVASLAAANTMAGRKSNNIANAHIVFAQKEIDDIRNELGIDYLKDTKYAGDLMKRYSAFTLMVANDAGQRVYILDDKDNISWDAVPYSAIRGKEGGDSLDAALAKLSRL